MNLQYIFYIVIGFVSIIIIISAFIPTINKKNKGIKQLSKISNRGALGLLSNTSRTKENKDNKLSLTSKPGIIIGNTIKGKHEVYSGFEDTRIIIAAPRRMKTTGLVARFIEQAPGNVLITSNKKDIVDYTLENRKSKGDVYIFDPQQIYTKDKPEYVYNPLVEINNILDAQELSRIFSSTSITNERESHWDIAAQDLIASLILAAKYKSCNLMDIWKWITDIKSIDEAGQILEEKNESSVLNMLLGVMQQPDETRGSVFATAQRICRSLLNPKILEWSDINNKKQWNIKEYLDNTDRSIYLLSKEGIESCALLTTALTTQIAKQAVKKAENNDNGRLDIPLIIELDEAANICPWKELPALYSHFGSRGILIGTYLQSWSQGMKVWGKEGMQTLWDASTLRIYAGGGGDDRFMRMLQQFIGKEEKWKRSNENIVHKGGLRKTKQLQKDYILDISHIYDLPLQHALVFPSIGRPLCIKLNPIFNDFKDDMDEEIKEKIVYEN